MAVIDALKGTIADVSSDGRGNILLAVAFGWFLSISVRMIYPALLPLLREAYGLTLTNAGLLLTVLWIGYAFGQLPGGILADWTGERILLVASSLLAATMLTLVIVADSALVLFAATALFGGGTALYGVSRFTILEKIYDEHLGTATGTTMAAGDVGNAVMPPAAGSIAVVLGWQFGFGFAVPLFLLAAFGLWITLPTQTLATGSLNDHLDFGSLRSTLADPVIRQATLLLVLWAVVLQAFIGFYPTYLMEELAFSPWIATTLFGFFFALGILVKPLAGRAYDNIGVKWPLVVTLGTAGVALALLPFFGGIVSLVILTVLASGLLGSETVVISDLTKRLPAGAQGMSLGAVRTIYITIGAVSPLLFGAAADLGYFDEAFVGTAAISGVAILVVVWFIDY